MEMQSKKRGRPKKNIMENQEKTPETIHEEVLKVFSKMPDTITSSEPLTTITKDMNKINSSPPNKAGARNSFGLLENVNHIFDEFGFPNWRAMLKPEYLVFNSQFKDKIEKIYGKKLEDIKIIEDSVKDEHLLILLANIKYIARLRGIKSVNCEIITANDSYAGVISTVKFIPNYENPQGLIYSDVGCAFSGNTKGFGQSYLLEMAANRAFQRAIRGALNILIITRDELGANLDNSNGESISNDPTSPHHALQNNMDKYKVSWGQLQSALIKKEKDGQKLYPDAAQWTNVLTVPKEKVYGIIGLLVDAQNKNGVK